MKDARNFQGDLTVSTFHRRFFDMVNNIPGGEAFKSIRHEHRVKEDIGFINSLATCMDGSVLALASRELAVVFDVATETELMRFKVLSGQARSVSLSEAGHVLAVGDTGGVVTILDLVQKKVFRHYQHNYGVHHVHLSGGGNYVAVALGKKAFVYNNETGLLVREITCESTIHSVRLVSLKDDVLVEVDTGIEVWSLRSGRKKRILTKTGSMDSSRPIESIYPAMKFIQNSAILWDATTGDMRGRFDVLSNITDLAFSESRRGHVAVASEDGYVSVYKEYSEQSITSLKHSDAVTCVDISFDGTRVFSACDTARVWDSATGSCLKAFKGHGSHVIVAKLSRDEQRLLVGGGDGVLKMYDLGTGCPVRRFEGHSGWITAVALCEDMKRVATAAHDYTARIYSFSGELLHVLRGHDDFLHAVAICPHNGIIVTGGRDSRIILWDMATGKHCNSWKAHEGWVRSLAFSQDGKYILSAGNDGIARLWETSTNALIMEYGFHADILYSAVISPDSRFIATAGNDSVLKIFNLDGTGQRVLMGHVAGVRNALFHRDGTLFSVGLDCTARRWSPETGECLMIYRDLHFDWIRTVSVTSNGVLILGSKDGTVSFSDIETGECIAKMYHLDQGYLWTCPGESDSASGWFWTDREELIEVLEIDQEGKSTTSAIDCQSRKDHIALCNSMTRVMSRIRNKGRDHGQFERFAALHRERMGQEKYPVVLPSPDLQQSER